MPLNAGNPEATEGLALEIFQVLDARLRPPLEESLPDPDEQIPPIQAAWRELSFCVAEGVIEHLERDPATAPEFAEAFSSSAQDAAFWGWMSGFANVFRNWASSAGSLPQLHSALNSFLGSNPTPTQIRGILR